MYCATVLYPSRDDAAFDLDTYAKTLAPLYAGLLGDNCVRFEVRKGLVAPGRPSPHVVCIASFWVTSKERYGASLNDPRFKEVMAKFAAFTDIEPLRQFDEVCDTAP